MCCMSRLDFDDDSMSIVVGVADAKANAHPLVVQVRDVYQHVREVLVVGECCEADRGLACKLREVGEEHEGSGAVLILDFVAIFEHGVEAADHKVALIVGRPALHFGGGPIRRSSRAA